MQEAATYCIKPANTLTFTAGFPSEWVFRINYDTFSVELNEGVDWDDAAKLFWEHVALNAPQGFTIKK